MNKRKKIDHFKIVTLLLYPLASSYLLTRIFYPGFMSYDTLHALRAARGEVTDSIWPPMVSYVWRMVDFFSDDPSAMHFFQVSILFCAVTYIVHVVTENKFITWIALPALLAVPVILGTLVVIWKDVLTSSFMFGAFALTLLIKRHASSLNKFTLTSFTLGTLAVIFVGIAARHNSIVGAIPFVAYLSFHYLKALGVQKRRLLAAGAALTIVLSASLYGGKTLLDNYSIPEMKQLGGTSAFFEGLQILDLAGASVCASENYMKEVAPSLDLSSIQSGYDPRHVNLSEPVTSQVTKKSSIQSSWFQVLQSNPGCLLYQRTNMFAWMTGIFPGEQFLITAPAVNENEFGYVLKPNGFRDGIVQALIANSHLFFFRPWFVFGMAAIGLLLARKAFQINTELLILFSSGVFYALGLFLTGNAADARLLFHSNVAFILVALITWLQWISLRARGRKY